MKKSCFALLAAAALALTALSCGKYDDSELRSKIESLDSRLSKLESSVNGIQTVVDALKAGKTVTDVQKTAGGYTLTFSDGTTATLAGTVGTALSNGVYCWTVNGEFLKDGAGNYIAVTSATAPLFRTQNGELQVSVDGGKTWQTVHTGDSDITVTEDATSVTVTIGGKSVVLAKELPFAINISVPADFSIAYNAKGTLNYTLSGVASGVTPEVGILNNGQGYTAVVKNTSATAGTLEITNKQEAAGKVQVIVYAADHKGHSDIKAISFTSGEGAGQDLKFEAVLSAQSVPAEGGQYTLNVSADEDYNVSVEQAAQSWLTVVPPTRAKYEDKLAVTVKANTEAAPRTGTITLSSKTSTLSTQVVVMQEAAEVAASNYLDNIGFFTVSGTGEYYDMSGNTPVVKTGTVTYDAWVDVADDESEDYYWAGLTDEEGYLITYILIDRDAETGELALYYCITDEWERQGTPITDYQCPSISYSGGLYPVSSDGELPIGFAEAPKDGVFTFESAGQVSITGYGDFDIQGIIFVGAANGNMQNMSLYASLPFPITFTKTGDFPEEESSVMARKPGKTGVKKHAFAPANLQMFVK